MPPLNKQSTKVVSEINKCCCVQLNKNDISITIDREPIWKDVDPNSFQKGYRRKWQQGTTWLLWSCWNSFLVLYVLGESAHVFVLMVFGEWDVLCTVQLLTKKNYENKYNQIRIVQIHGFFYFYGMLSKCVQLTYGEVEKAMKRQWIPTSSLLVLNCWELTWHAPHCKYTCNLHVYHQLLP